MNHWRSYPSVIYSLYYFLTILHKQDFFSWFYRSIAYTHKQMTRCSNLSKATVFVETEDIASVLESWKSGKTLICLSADTGGHRITHFLLFNSFSKKWNSGQLPFNKLVWCLWENSQTVTPRHMAKLQTRANFFSSKQKVQTKQKLYLFSCVITTQSLIMK